MERAGFAAHLGERPPRARWPKPLSAPGRPGRDEALERRAGTRPARRSARQPAEREATAGSVAGAAQVPANHAGVVERPRRVCSSASAFTNRASFFGFEQAARRTRGIAQPLDALAQAMARALRPARRSAVRCGAAGDARRRGALSVAPRFYGAGLVCRDDGVPPARRPAPGLGGSRSQGLHGSSLRAGPSPGGRCARRPPHASPRRSARPAGCAMATGRAPRRGRGTAPPRRRYPAHRVQRRREQRQRCRRRRRPRAAGARARRRSRRWRSGWR